MDIHFLNPASPEQSDSQHVLDAILSMIRDTSDVLRIAVAYFTHPDIAQALIERTKHGKATRLLVNTADLVRPVHPQQAEFIISQHLIEVVGQGRPLLVRALGGFTEATYQTMHHKFMVAQHGLLFGSLNWTMSAFTSNFECIAITTESRIIDAFIAEHDRLWSRSAALRTSGVRVQIIICPHCQATEGIDFQSWGPLCTQCGKRFRLTTIEGSTNKAAG